MKRIDFVNEFIRAKYNSKVAKATKDIKQVCKFIDEKNLSETEKQKLKETFNKIYNIVYSNTKSKAIANEIITVIAYKLNILHNKKHETTFQNDRVYKQIYNMFV